VLDPLFRRDPDVVTHPDVEGPPLTDEMVAAAEQELGVTLPPAYVALMRTCNGGYTAGAVMPTAEPTSWAPDHVPVDVMHGIPAVGDRGRMDMGVGILQTAYMTAEWDLPEGLVLLNGDGHWWIALDYEGSGPAGPPSVVWIDVESDEELELARTFEAFLLALVPETDLP
jgi:hypothetical protein